MISRSFHQYSWNSGVETTWKSLIGWRHRTSNSYQNPQVPIYASSCIKIFDWSKGLYQHHVQTTDQERFESSPLYLIGAWNCIQASSAKIKLWGMLNMQTNTNFAYVIKLTWSLLGIIKSRVLYKSTCFASVTRQHFLSSRPHNWSSFKHRQFKLPGVFRGITLR